MQKDLSAAAEFAKRFATEAACRDYLIQLRWPEGFRCPHCGGRENWRLKNARFECRACGRQTSATAGNAGGAGLAPSLDQPAFAMATSHEDNRGLVSGTQEELAIDPHDIQVLPMFN